MGAGEDLKKVKGLAFYENGEFIETGFSELVEDLDSLPFPDYEGFEFDYFLDNFPLIDNNNIHPHGVRQRRMAGKGSGTRSF